MDGLIIIRTAELGEVLEEAAKRVRAAYIATGKMDTKDTLVLAAITTQFSLNVLTVLTERTDRAASDRQPKEGAQDET